jgi:hypothetical protein
LVQNRTWDTSRPLSFGHPVTPINDENDPGSVASSSRHAPSSSRNSRRRPLDRVPLGHLVDPVEQNDDRYLNEMLPPSHRPVTSTDVIAPQGSPAEVEAMLMVISSDEDDELRFDSRNARRRQFLTRSPARVMRTRITGGQQALLLNEPYSREERPPGSPLVPGGRPATPVGPLVPRQPPLELRGAGTPVQDVEMLDTSPAPVNPFLVPPSAIVRDPHARPFIRARRQATLDDLPPLADLPLSPASPHRALNRYMTGEHSQAAWDALWETDATTDQVVRRISLPLIRRTFNSQFGDPHLAPPQPREYVRPAGKSIKEWIEEREKVLAAESSGGAQQACSATVEEVPDKEK